MKQKSDYESISNNGLIIVFDKYNESMSDFVL